MSERTDLLVVGGDGLIGGALVKAARARGLQVISTSRREGQGDLSFDLARPETWPVLPRVEAVVIAAAVARLAAVAADAAGSAAVNVGGPTRLAEQCRASGTFCLYLSSDKIFDGTLPLRDRHDPPCPMTEYGRQKMLGEASVLASGGAVLRLSKVLAPGLPLLAGWREQLRAGTPIHPFSDMVLAPVALAGVAALILRIVRLQAGGVFHYTGAADRPYADLAFALARRLEADPALVQPVPAPQSSAAGILVPHSSLEMERERELFGLDNPAFEAVANEILI